MATEILCRILSWLCETGRAARALVPALVALLAFGATTVRAADGSIDPAFAGGGREVFPVTDSASDTPRVLRFSNGKLLIAGDCAPYGVCVVRLSAAGVIDTSFGTSGNGRVLLSDLGLNSSLRVVDMQIESDGRIALAGQDGGSNGWTAILKSDGTALDKNAHGQSSFFSFGFPGNLVAIDAMALQANGQILVAGSILYTSQPPSPPPIGPPIGGGGSNGLTLPSASIPPNETFTHAILVYRVSNDSTMADINFGTQGSVTFSIGYGPNYKGTLAHAIAVQADQRIVIAGTIPTAIGTKIAGAIGLARLLSNGEKIDSSFADGGAVAYEPGQFNVTSMTIDAQNRLVIGGDTGESWLVDRRLSDGNVDSSFNNGVPLIYSIVDDNAANRVNNIFVTRDGIYPVGNTFSAFDNRSYWAVSRINFDGTLNSSFGGSGSSYASYSTSETADAGTDIAVTPTGIVVTGFAKTASGATEFGLTRLKLDHIFGDSFE